MVCFTSCANIRSSSSIRAIASSSSRFAVAGSSLRCALTACATSLLTFVTRTGLGAIPGLTPSGPNEARNPAVQRGPDLILATTLCCQTSLPGAAHENRSKRREFIILIGGAAARPLAASAQQGERVRKVGLLMGMESDPEARSRVKAFRPPEELGWSEDRNTKIEAVWGAGDADHVRADAADLIRAAPDVIVTNGAVRTTEVAKATAVIPVVFVQLPDPVDPRHRSRPCTSGAQCYRLHPLWLLPSPRGRRPPFFPSKSQVQAEPSPGLSRLR